MPGVCNDAGMKAQAAYVFGGAASGCVSARALRARFGTFRSRKPRVPVRCKQRWDARLMLVRYVCPVLLADERVRVPSSAQSVPTSFPHPSCARQVLDENIKALHVCPVLHIHIVHSYGHYPLSSMEHVRCLGAEPQRTWLSVEDSELPSRQLQALYSELYRYRVICHSDAGGLARLPTPYHPLEETCIASLYQFY